MARYTLIVLLLALSLTGHSRRYMVQICQNDPAFLADRAMLREFFTNRYAGMVILKPGKYSLNDVTATFDMLTRQLSSSDTLIVTVSAHGWDRVACTILVDNRPHMNYKSDVVPALTYVSFLKKCEAKRIRTLFVMNACHGTSILPTAITGKFAYVTTIYPSQNIALGTMDGSLFSIGINSIRLPDVRGYINSLSQEWTKQKYYQGNDLITGKLLSEYYPINPLFTGPNFVF